MTNTEALSFLALFILAVAMLLTDHMIMAIIAIIPLVATSFKYSFPQKKSLVATTTKLQESKH